MPQVADYVKKRTFEAALLNKYLSYMHDNQASGEQAALEFMLNEEATWSQWVSKDAAARIKNHFKRRCLPETTGYVLSFRSFCF